MTDTQFVLILVLPLLVFLVALVAYPLGYSFWLSLHDVNIFVGVFKYVGFGQYARVLSDPLLLTSIVVTVRFAFESTIISVFVALATALLLNERIPGRGVLRTAVLLPWTISAYATAMLWKFLLSSQFGFYNGILYMLGLTSSYIEFFDKGLVIETLATIFSWRVAPLSAFFLLAGMQTVPEDLYKSAKIDGAGPFRRFWHITLPHIRYSMLIVIVLNTMLAAKELDTIFIGSSGGPAGASKVLAYYAYERTFAEMNAGFGAAISYVLMFIMLAITTTYFILLSRRRAA